MKRFLVCLWLFAVAGDLRAQTLTMDKVPSACTQAFRAKFPSGSQPGWKKAGAAIYEVQFFDGKKRQSALFDESGKWLQTQSEISYGQIPGKVNNAFIKQFEQYQVQEAYETETTDYGLCYEIVGFNRSGSVIVLFSAKGELLKKDESSADE